MSTSTLSSSVCQLDAYIRELLAFCQEKRHDLPDYEPFNYWIEHEQNGYDAQDLLPGYRHILCEHQGIFSDSRGQPRRLETIRASTLNARDRCQLQYMALRAPLYHYLEESQVLREPWPKYFLTRYRHELIPEMTCLQAWQTIAPAPVSRMLAGMLEHLRSLLLDAGEEYIETLNPIICELGEHYPKIKPLWNSRPQNHMHTPSYS